MQGSFYFQQKNSSTKDELGLVGNREDRIRTCDTLVPNQVLYQAELLPEDLKIFSNNKTGKPELIIMHPAGFEPATA